MQKLFLYSTLFYLAVSILLTASPVSAATDPVQAPDGFNLQFSSQGVDFFQKNYPGGSPDYVQVANLVEGAQVILLHGGMTTPGQGQGVYGGDNPRFSRLPIQSFWQKLSGASANPVCVTNGQFFHLADDPTPLPFPLKQDNQILSDGYGIKEFPGQKLMLELWPDHLDIRDLSQDNLYSSFAPDIVGGLTEDAEKASKKAVGRTFIGIADENNDGQYEVLMIFNTRTAKPSAAAQVLRDFGAAKVMMLDGGGSTQLVCHGEAYIDTGRAIPQAIGLASGIPISVPTEVPAAIQNVSQSLGGIQETAKEINQPSLDKPIFETELHLDLGNLFWVPLIMIPICILVLASIKKSQLLNNY